MQGNLQGKGMRRRRNEGWSFTKLSHPLRSEEVKTCNESGLLQAGKGSTRRKNLAKELDKESGVKRTLAEEFESVAKATDLDSQHVDFVLVSPSKATKDDKDAKAPAYGRRPRATVLLRVRKPVRRKAARS
ncbi:hypothetical protein Bca52824_095113 [Brassica carinata]|uniref:Uncharacterized protein n=1 Tax=Brassica carinata TaxID=52824 RepID=A0A8X7TIB9_BRACI|nr:hypothetical protein Bca52824_095113 [Brassica carinata]